MKTRAGIQQKNKTEISNSHWGRSPQFPSVPSAAALSKETRVNRTLSILQRARENEKVWTEAAEMPRK